MRPATYWRIDRRAQLDYPADLPWMVCRLGAGSEMPTAEELAELVRDRLCALMARDWHPHTAAGCVWVPTGISRAEFAVLAAAGIPSRRL